jgi:quinoprotein glucose dehydrogenase
MKYLGLFAAFLLLASCSSSIDADDSFGAAEDWAFYQGDPYVSQYSRLDQINVDNVSSLEVAWVFRSGDVDTANRSQIQCNPLVIDGVLYGSSPKLKIFALDAASGEELWRFDPFDDAFALFGAGVNRGLAYWADGDDRRILYAAGAALFALDAGTGRPIPSFGQAGRVDLKEGLGRDVSNYFISANTPGVVYEDLYILGMRVSESTGAAPGHIRAYNVRTGAMEWIFHTIPHPGEFGYETWPEDAYSRIGGANAWAGLSLDEQRGIVYVPTGSAAFDFYGGDRIGENLFANSLIALDARTGQRRWHFQMVQHDLWDRDLPAPANLLTVAHRGRKIPAAAQITKSGHVFLFDRVNGKPLFPIERIEAPPSDLIGEQAWPTQPLPLKPPPFARQHLDEEHITRRSPEAHAYVREIWEGARRGPFVPFSEKPTMIFPGFDGGGEWGGAAHDPEGILYVNANEMPWLTQMKRHESTRGALAADRGQALYNAFCLMCHGKDLKGASIHTVPSLADLPARSTSEQVAAAIKNGQGMMPSFANLGEADINALTSFLMNLQAPDTPDDKPEKTAGANDEGKEAWPYPYVFAGYNRLKDQDGFPAITPPWGTLSAIDLNKGEILWRIPLGHHPSLPPAEGEPWGCENYGGPVVTAGNVLFIAATMDEKIRAFDKRDGRLLWQADLPAAGYATPAVYMVNGRQYVVIACGGGKLGTKSGDAYVAFALPR